MIGKRRARRRGPIKITTRVMLNDKELTTVVNEWNARNLAAMTSAQVRQFMAAQDALNAAYKNDPVRLRADADRLEAEAREKRRRADEIDGGGLAPAS